MKRVLLAIAVVAVVVFVAYLERPGPFLSWWGWTAVAAQAQVLAAVGTVGTLFMALWQIRNERNRRIAQEAKARVERHRAQAGLLAAWAGKPVGHRQLTPVHVINSSDEPVYAVVASIVFIQGAAPRTTEALLEFAQRQSEQPTATPITTLSIVPPGRWRAWIAGANWAGFMGARLGSELAFTDRAGTHWIRRASGELEELPDPPLEYFGKRGMPGPYDFQEPEADA